MTVSRLKFSEQALLVTEYAEQEARSLRQAYVGTEHLLLGLLRSKDQVISTVFESLELSIEDVRKRIVEIIGQSKKVPKGRLPLTPRAKHALEWAPREAAQTLSREVKPEHILLSLLRDIYCVARQILRSAIQLTDDTIRFAVIEAMVKSMHEDLDMAHEKARLAVTGAMINSMLGVDVAEEAHEDNDEGGENLYVVAATFYDDDLPRAAREMRDKNPDKESRHYALLMARFFEHQAREWRREAKRRAEVNSS